ncbi:MAG: FTR1 family protein [Nitrososphaeraceae archaeon]
MKLIFDSIFVKLRNYHYCLYPTLFIFILFILSPNPVYSQVSNTTDENITDNYDLEKLFIIFINFERILSQLDLTEMNLNSNNRDNAFVQSYIPHKTTFPSIKDEVQNIDLDLSTQIEDLLTSLPLSMTDRHRSIEGIKENINETRSKINVFYNNYLGEIISNNNLNVQSAIVLLKDFSKFHNTLNINSTDNDRIIIYQSMLEALDSSKNKLSSILVDQTNTNNIENILSLYSSIRSNVANNDLSPDDSRITNLENELHQLSKTQIEINKLPSDLENYFSTIKILLNDAIHQIQENNDYKKADKNVIAAYLDNYEYLEAPIERNDPDLMVDIEMKMREDLRELIKNQESISVIESFVNQILNKLDEAKQILITDPSITSSPQNTGTVNIENNFVDIDELSKGFGAYQGERKEMGESTDPAKQGVRNDIDKIRLGIKQTLDLYKVEKYEEAFSSARSAYLDSYENIEIPLRPIDPDFTLEMEILFAELRNLIEQRAPYETVLAKTSEIHDGLDESERLVSGTGLLAPGIAFSSSFSIIFREGLESALILGAIITYLEASRNERFKKHVYYGIFLAAGATAITWIIAQYIIEISGAQRELIEAIAGISAVAVLFWVSFWVLNKLETKKWIEFVKSKVWKATTTGSVMVFVMLSFFTVYREGFETVLFYQAMLSYAKHMEFFVFLGLVLGLVVIVGVALLVRKLGKKLPLRVLFGLTMGIGAYMSITFLGNAIREFQELGYIPTTHLFGIVPRLDINLATMTGIHPTLETIVAQLILLSVYLSASLYILVIQPRRSKLITKSRKSMSDFKKSNINKK